MREALDDPMAVFDDPAWRAELAVLVGWTGQAAQRYAFEAVHLAGMAAQVPAPVGTGEGALAWQSFLREVAVAGGIGDTAAMHQVERAVLLSRHLPRTLAQLAAGTLPVGRAWAFLDELRHLDVTLAAVLDAELAGRIHLLAPARIRQQVRRSVDRHDADAAAARKAHATRGRGIRWTAERDGQAAALITGPAVPLTRWYTALTDTAQALRTAGDPRGLDALRFDLLVAGFTAPHHPAPAPAAPTTPAASRPGSPPRPAPATPAPASPAPASPAPAAPAPAGLAVTAREQADRLVGAALAEAERILAAAHTAEAAVTARLHQARAEADRLTAHLLAARLAASQHPPTDRRSTRPVQLLVHVPVQTALGLTNDPAWLDGYGWIDAPSCRQLLPLAELRQVCTTGDGTVIDLAPTIIRPAPDPTAIHTALLEMATRPFTITDTAWQHQDQHDPSDALADLVRIRDRFCDGPTGQLWPAHRSDLDHTQPYPDGPTAAYNLAARARRSHRLKHRGWTPQRTATTTTWTSPAGQTSTVPRHTQPPTPPERDAQVPDAQQLHDLEAELTRTPDHNDDPPTEPPF